jgi:hypothetical protein
MRGGVATKLTLVVALGHDLSLMKHERAYRHVSVTHGCGCLAQCDTHRVVVGHQISSRSCARQQERGAVRPNSYIDQNVRTALGPSGRLTCRSDRICGTAK